MKTPHLLILVCAATVLGASAAGPDAEPPIVALCFVTAPDAFAAIVKKLGVRAAAAVTRVDERTNTVTLDLTHPQAAAVRDFLIGIDH
jgi:hypothetical protein